jgi:hypothetical protein
VEKLPLETQTLYAELLEQLTAHEAERTIGAAPGSFVKKNIKGRDYYYFQYLEPGGAKRQVYVGLQDESLDGFVHRYREARLQESRDGQSIERLAALLRAGEAIVTDTASGRVIRSLSDSGVFRLGAVLVGTHAFATLGNVLGVRWGGASLRTMDIDVAAARVLDVVVPDLRADVPKVLEGLELGFLPVPQLNRKAPSTSFKVRGQSLRVDLLTPASRSAAPVMIPRLGAAALPLKFLDYLIESPIRAAIIDGGATLVNVPDPARFGLHKLITAIERPATEHSKRAKDLAQAAEVLRLLSDERPGDLALAFEALAERGKGWASRIERGGRALRRVDEEAAAVVEDLFRR